MSNMTEALMQKEALKQNLTPKSRRDLQTPPWWIWTPALAFVAFLTWLIEKIQPPHLVVMDKALAFIDSHVVCLCAKLSIPEKLQDGPLTLQQLAAKLDMQVESCGRLIQAAVQIGFFKLTPGPGGVPLVENSRLSSVMHENDASGLKPMLKLQYEETLPSFANLEYALRTADDLDAPSAFAKHYGLEMWEYYERHPQHQINFSRAMKAVDVLGVQSMVEDYNWSKHPRILDIGGSSGSFLAALLRHHKKPTGVVCDLVQVLELTRRTWATSPALEPLAPRVSFANIDFLKRGTLPAAKNGDCFLMRNILHDWTDIQSIAILRNLRTAFGSAKATLAIVEMSIIDPARHLLTGGRAKSDLIMLTQSKGKERTKEQWETLFAATGFELSRIVTTRSLFYVILAQPVVVAA